MRASPLGRTHAFRACELQVCRASGRGYPSARRSPLLVGASNDGCRCGTSSVMLHHRQSDSSMTKHPRLSVTLSPEAAAVLSDLAQLGGQSRSSLVAELVETTLPVLQHLAVILRAASRASLVAKGELARNLEGAQSRLEEQLLIVSSEFSRISDPLLASVSDAPAPTPPAEPGAASLEPSTPFSNRGVTAPGKTPAHPLMPLRR